MKKNTGCDCHNHHDCPPGRACDTVKSKVGVTEVTPFTLSGETEETVVLADVLLQTQVEAEIELPTFAREIKNIRKNIRLTQCKALPNSLDPTGFSVKLMVEGVVHKNIQFVEDCNGSLKDFAVDVPFRFFQQVQLENKVINALGEFSSKNSNVFERREIADNGMEADPCISGSLTFEVFNEPVQCKLLATSINEWDIFKNHDNWGRFNKITEKMDINLAIKLTQKQPFGGTEVTRVLYVSSIATDKVEIYDITNPINPIHLGEFNSQNLDAPTGMALIGDTLYVTNAADNNVEIYDISNPTSPQRIGEFGNGELVNPNAMTIIGNTLYVTNLIPDNVEIYDILDPLSPVRIKEFGNGELNGPNGLAIIDNILYVSNSGDATIEIYDITDPINPININQFGANDLSNPIGLAITGNTLYVANFQFSGSNRVEIYDISNPINPVRVGEFGFGELNGPCELAITGNTLYVANLNSSTVEIYDISNPLAPSRIGEFGSGELSQPFGLIIVDTTIL